MILKRLLPCAVASALLLPAAHSARAETSTSSSRAQTKTRGVAFSKLVLREKGKTAVSASDAETRIFVTEYLRSRGINALGAESLVFDQDRSAEADLALGGTIFEVSCASSAEHHCRMGIEWELFDVALDQVVYRARVYGEFHQKRTSNSKTVRILIESALKDLLSKQHFQELLKAVVPRDLEKSPYSSTPIQGCSRPASPVEAGADAALNAVAIVANSRGFGSGFFVSDGPYLLTAAHVVETTPLTIRFRNGHESPGTPVRVDPAADVALIRVDQPPDEHGCLTLAATSSVKVGGPVFALGSPASEELAFSVTRGVLSGVRSIGGLRRYQTDAAISPGNSGGPLLDGGGQVLGVTSFKLTGKAIEGIAFAISAQDAMLRLGLTFAEETGATLASEKYAAPSTNVAIYTEPPEPKPVLDAAADARRKVEEREQAIRKHREEITPTMVPWLRWGGVVSAGVGAIGILATDLAADTGDTRGQYNGYVAANTVFWGLLGVGVAATIVSFPLEPTMKAAEKDYDKQASVNMLVSPTSISLSGSF